MQFLRTLFAVMVAVVAVIFSVRNWTTVTIHLWGGIDADVKLPVMLLAAFLLGFLPAFVLYRTTRWRLRRRLDAAERTIALNAAAAAAVVPVEPAPDAPHGGVAPPANPMVTP